MNFLSLSLFESRFKECRLLLSPRVRPYGLSGGPALDGLLGGPALDGLLGGPALDGLLGASALDGLSGASALDSHRSSQGG
ncbi:MAG: hypothetical protein LIP02_14105 [Bacteroidales bacterium]|nr:hypothetical protein [Bacteroidales bacterium]